MEQREAAVVRRRRLRAELCRLREERALGPKEVGDALGWSASKVTRIESGTVKVSTSDVMALLHYYGNADMATAEDLLATTRARDDGWWDQYSGFYDRQFVNFLGYEDSATRICQYLCDVVPGLLQTEEYARVLIGELSQRPGGG